MEASIGALRCTRGTNAHLDFVDRLFAFDSRAKTTRPSPGNSLTCCAPHLAAHLCQIPSPGPAVPARVPCLAAVCPELAPLVPAPDVGQRLAVGAGSDAALTRLALAACPAVRCP